MFSNPLLFKNREGKTERITKKSFNRRLEHHKLPYTPYTKNVPYSTSETRKEQPPPPEGTPPALSPMDEISLTKPVTVAALFRESSFLPPLPDENHEQKSMENSTESISLDNWTEKDIVPPEDDVLSLTNNVQILDSIASDMEKMESIVADAGISTDTDSKLNAICSPRNNLFMSRRDLDTEYDNNTDDCYDVGAEVDLNDAKLLRYNIGTGDYIERAQYVADGNPVQVDTSASDGAGLLSKFDNIINELSASPVASTTFQDEIINYFGGVKSGLSSSEIDKNASHYGDNYYTSDSLHDMDMDTKLLSIAKRLEVTTSNISEMLEETQELCNKRFDDDSFGEIEGKGDTSDAYEKGDIEEKEALLKSLEEIDSPNKILSQARIHLLDFCAESELLELQEDKTKTALDALHVLDSMERKEARHLKLEERSEEQRKAMEKNLKGKFGNTKRRSGPLALLTGHGKANSRSILSLNPKHYYNYKKKGVLGKVCGKGRKSEAAALETIRQERLERRKKMGLHLLDEKELQRLGMGLKGAAEKRLARQERWKREEAARKLEEEKRKKKEEKDNEIFKLKKEHPHLSREQLEIILEEEKKIREQGEKRRREEKELAQLRERQSKLRNPWNYVCMQPTKKNRLVAKAKRLVNAKDRMQDEKLKKEKISKIRNAKEFLKNSQESSKASKLKDVFGKGSSLIERWRSHEMKKVALQRSHAETKKRAKTVAELKKRYGGKKTRKETERWKDPPPSPPQATEQEDPAFQAIAKWVDRDGDGICSSDEMYRFFDVCFGGRMEKGSSMSTKCHPLVLEQIPLFIENIEKIVTRNGKYRNVVAVRYFEIVLHGMFRGEYQELCSVAKSCKVVKPRNDLLSKEGNTENAAVDDRLQTRRWAPKMHLLMHCKCFQPLCWEIAASFEFPADGITHLGVISGQDFEKFCAAMKRASDENAVMSPGETVQFAHEWAQKHNLKREKPMEVVSISDLASAIENEYMSDLAGLLLLADYLNIAVAPLLVSKRAEERRADAKTNPEEQIDNRALDFIKLISPHRSSVDNARVTPKSMVDCCNILLKSSPGSHPADRLQLPILLNRVCQLSGADVAGCTEVGLAKAVDAILSSFVERDEIYQKVQLEASLLRRRKVDNIEKSDQEYSYSVDNADNSDEEEGEVDEDSSFRFPEPVPRKEEKEKQRIVL